MEFSPNAADCRPTREKIILRCDTTMSSSSTNSNDDDDDNDNDNKSNEVSRKHESEESQYSGEYGMDEIEDPAVRKALSIINNQTVTEEANQQAEHGSAQQQQQQQQPQPVENEEMSSLYRDKMVKQGSATVEPTTRETSTTVEEERNSFGAVNKGQSTIPAEMVQVVVTTSPSSSSFGAQPLPPGLSRQNDVENQRRPLQRPGAVAVSGRTNSARRRSLREVAASLRNSFGGSRGGQQQQSSTFSSSDGGRRHSSSGNLVQAQQVVLEAELVPPQSLESQESNVVSVGEDTIHATRVVVEKRHDGGDGACCARHGKWFWIVLVLAIVATVGVTVAVAALIQNLGSSGPSSDSSDEIVFFSTGFPTTTTTTLQPTIQPRPSVAPAVSPSSSSMPPTLSSSPATNQRFLQAPPRVLFLND